jgi:protein-S-isoprenylcysteine O-methyltransferase Ste14
MAGRQRRTTFLFPLFLAVAALGAVFWRHAMPGPGVWAWMAMIVAQFAIRAPWVGAVRDNVVHESRRDLGENLLLGLAFAGMLVLPLVAIGTPLLTFADYATPPALLWAGIAVALPGLWLFHRSHADLGRHWSPSLELHAAQSLVTAGVYARIRHPMYAAIWLLCLAQALLLGNAIAGPAGLVAFALLYAIRLPREEAMLAARFGPDWDAYARRSGRLWPRRAAPTATDPR